MRNRTSPWQSYRQIATQTATPGQLVLMLFDGAIRFMERALAGFDEEDPLQHNLTINNNILRAQQIIQELDASLNMREGGEFAVTMRRLYDYCNRRLTESNSRKEPDGLKEVLQRIGVLRDAWAQMLEQQGQRSGVDTQSGVLAAQA